MWNYNQNLIEVNIKIIIITNINKQLNKIFNKVYMGFWLKFYTPQTLLKKLVILHLS